MTFLIMNLLIINEIKVSKDKFMMSDIGIKFTRIFSFDTSAIRLFVAAFCLELMDLWNDACKRLKETEIEAKTT